MIELTEDIDKQVLLVYCRQLKQSHEALKEQYLKMEVMMHKMLQMAFGSKSERFIPNTAQLSLDIQIPQEPASCKIAEAKKVSYVKPAEPKKRDLSEMCKYLEKLPHVFETREPENIPAGAIKIGEEKHELLECTPGKLFVKVVVIPKYKIPASDNTTTTIIEAPAPAKPLFKCIAAPSVLAQILVDKFCDQLPLYRQAKRFERNGVSLPYNTIVEWTAKTVDLLSPLHIPLKKQILGSGYIHVDETKLKVLLGKENQKSKMIHDGFLWGYNDSINKLVFFDYQPGRGEKCTEGILKNFNGIIQTDGWHVYEKVAAKQKEITQICCLAHARRKFTEALPYDKERAEYALTKFNALYEIERNCKKDELPYEQIAQVRQDKAIPILNELHKWMLNEIKSLLPSSPMMSALRYNLERWDRLVYYVNDGKLQPDNNCIERSIRPIAVGRKNFLFAGSHKGAERLAMMYGLMGTCSMNNINPTEWLTDVIARINNYPMNKLHELLPNNWKSCFQETKITEAN